MKILIEAKYKPTGQLYTQGEVFHVTGVILRDRDGEISKLRVFDNNTGIIHTRPIEDFEDIVVTLVPGDDKK